MSLWTKIRGTIETAWQLGLGGPNLKGNAGAVDVRNAADSAYAIVRGAAPVGLSDLTTKLYVDQIAKPIIVAAQFNGNSALPANTGIEQFFVVSTTGANATIGQLIFDDGTGVGTATVLATLDGRLIVTTVALVGGTATFQSDSLYAWDAGGSAWLNVGGSSTSGTIREIKMAITNAAAQSSATSLPANAVIVEAILEVVTPYSGGATVTLGRTGSAALLQATTDNLATVAGTYGVEQDTAWGGSALPLLVTVAGAPAAGAGFAIVRYCLPDA